MSETDRAEAREELVDLLDTIEEQGWKINGYDTDLDMYEQVPTTIHVQYDPDSDPNPPNQNTTGEIEEIIEKIEFQHEEGAPTEAVIDWAVSDWDYDREDVKERLSELKAKGEIYEPTTGHLKTT